jgi:hypothetical protein
MRQVMVFLALIVCVVLGATERACPGQNRECGVFVDFDGTVQDWLDVPYSGSRIDPEPGEVFSAYIGVFRIHIWFDWEHGYSYPVSHVTALPFQLDLPPESLVLLDIEALFPEGVVWEHPLYGFAVWGECVEGEVVYVARLELRYLGTPGDIIIEDAPADGRIVVDCRYDVDPFCLSGQGGVGKDPVPNEHGCFPNTPVERVSWGSIKAMYR